MDDDSIETSTDNDEHSDINYALAFLHSETPSGIDKTVDAAVLYTPV